MEEPIRLLATAMFGLESVVARELKELGYAPQQFQPGKVAFMGDFSAIARANLWLRTAERVLIHLDTFAANDFGQLFDGVRALPWEDWLPADASFPVQGRSVRSQLSSVPACQRIVKKAIVERLLAAHHVETLPEDGPHFRVEVALLKDQATLTLDTTGAGLHKRGYRPLTGPAPLRETLAAGLVLLSYWQPERPLLDPFCGTGTIPIEAALIAASRAPGLKREFTAEQWPTCPGAIWKEARAEAWDLLRKDEATSIEGCDIDERGLRMARQHAERAGVTKLVRFRRRAFADSEPEQEWGCLIGNPPYGERLGTASDVGALYRSIPQVLRRFPTWSHYILTSHPDFETLAGQPADRRRKLYNGRIPCTYYQFFGPPPSSRAEATKDQSDEPNENHQNATTEAMPAKRERTPAFGGLVRRSREQAELFQRRLQKRAKHLRRWPTKFGITCYRLYDRDIPEVPLVVDRYEDCLHITEYERPHEHTAAQHADWLDLMADTAGQVLGIQPEHVFVKSRERQRGNRQHAQLDQAKKMFTVSEGGLRFRVNLSDYIDTGLFLDHRITRDMVRQQAAGRHVLNLFCYTGAFTVYAANGGALSTTSVDASATYLDWARENLELNGIQGSRHQFVRDDVWDFLHQPPAGQKFGLAVVDPPTYSNSKDRATDWDVQRDHAELLRRLRPHLAPDAIVFFSSNFRRFRLDPAVEEIYQAREISRQTVPDDFRNRRVHRCWRLTLPAASE